MKKTEEDNLGQNKTLSQNARLELLSVLLRNIGLKGEYIIKSGLLFTISN
jgi:hypothetical protein